MKGFPKVIATGADLLNCLALVQTGQLKAVELAAAVAAIEDRAYITIPVLDMSNDRKTVVVADCGELVIGVSVDMASTSAVIDHVERPEPIEDAVELSATSLDGGTINNDIHGSELTMSAMESSFADVIPDLPKSGNREEQAHATVTLSNPLPPGSTTLRILAPHDPLGALGTTRQQLAAIKEVLNQYE